MKDVTNSEDQSIQKVRDRAQAIRTSPDATPQERNLAETLLTITDYLRPKPSNETPRLRIGELSITLTQSADDAGDSGLDQQLTVSRVDAGNGPYATLQTDRWAMEEEDIDALAELLRKLCADHLDLSEVG